MGNSNLRTFKLGDIKNLRVYGRTNGELDPLVLFWTGSGIEVNAKCSELWIEVEADYDMYEPWISIIVDNVPVSRRMVLKGREWICVLRNMNPDIVKKVQVTKDTQAMSADLSCCFKIHNIKCDGEFMPLEDKRCKVEFIGDSITSGEGAVGAECEQDWISMWFSSVHNYAYMTAKTLNADYRILSQSGWGVFTSWDNNPECTIPSGYEKICGVLKGEKNEQLGALKENDFEAWKPDVIVVNLGTNDAGAFDNAEYKDESTGKIYKQRRNEDGTYNEEDVARFENAVEEFLLKLRKYNKDSRIVWVYGMLGFDLMANIYHAVKQYKSKTGDKKVTVFQLPNTNDKTVGARSHPGVLSHRKAAEELSGYLKSILEKRNN